MGRQAKHPIGQFDSSLDAKLLHAPIGGA